MHLGGKEGFFLCDNKSKVEVKVPPTQGTFVFLEIRKAVSQCHAPTQGTSKGLKIMERDLESCTASS